MSHWRDLLMLNTLRAPVGNMRIFIRIRIRILHVVQSAGPHYTRSHFRDTKLTYPAPKFIMTPIAINISHVQLTNNELEQRQTSSKAK